LIQNDAATPLAIHFEGHRRRFISSEPEMRCCAPRTARDFRARSQVRHENRVKCYSNLDLRNSEVRRCKLPIA
jgi:hypothetical protein